jgi:hypothetical protein
LLKDAHAYLCRCETFQKSIGREYKVGVLLHPIIVEEPFEQWGLDIIVDIHP